MPRIPLSPYLVPPIAENDDAPAPRDGCGAAHPPLDGERAAMDLRAGELLLVGAMRAWVAPVLFPGHESPDWRGVFRLAAIPPAATQAFGALMALIAGNAQRLIDVRCCSCPSVSPDEAALVEIVAAAQSGDGVALLGRLLQWLPEDVLGEAVLAVQHVADAMHGPDLHLTSRPPRNSLPPGGTLH